MWDLQGLRRVRAGVENNGGEGRPYGMSGVLFEVVEGVYNIAMNGFLEVICACLAVEAPTSDYGKVSEFGQRWSENGGGLDGVVRAWVFF